MASRTLGKVEQSKSEKVVRSGFHPFCVHTNIFLSEISVPHSIVSRSMVADSNRKLPVQREILSSTFVLFGVRSRRKDGMFITEGVRLSSVVFSGCFQRAFRISLRESSLLSSISCLNPLLAPALRELDCRLFSNWSTNAIQKRQNDRKRIPAW